MIRQTQLVANRQGQHAGAAAKQERLASRYSSEVVLGREGANQRVDAKSILGVLMLAAGMGTRLVVSVEGEDEAEAAEAIRRLFEDRFGEVP